MYDWVLKYGKNLEYEMRSGFYENAKIDIIEVIE